MLEGGSYEPNEHPFCTGLRADLPQNAYLFKLIQFLLNILLKGEGYWARFEEESLSGVSVCGLTDITIHMQVFLDQVSIPVHMSQMHIHTT